MTQSVADNLEQILTSREFIQDPYPTYARLREESPIYWSEAWNCWLITSYDEVAASFKDVEHFSNANRFNGVFEQMPWDIRPELQPLENHFSKIGLLHSDPPDHTRMRKLIHMAFTPKVIRQLRDQVQQIVDRHLDAVQASGQMDVIWDLAFPLPATVIALLLGVPLDGIDSLKKWASEVLMFQATGRSTPDVMRMSKNSLVEMRAYLLRLVEERRKEPREDLISALVAAEDGGDKLSIDELLSTCVTLMIAGHETTTNLIANGLLLLLEHPDQRERLVAHPELMAGAVEEFLRLESPIQRNRRVIPKDFEYKGHAMKKGQVMLQMLGAANRDPSRFADPDTMDFTRDPNPHLAFGVGIHFCLGAPLARLEAPIALRSMLERMPNMKLAVEPDELEWLSATIMRNARSMPVTF